MNRTLPPLRLPTLPKEATPWMVALQRDLLRWSTLVTHLANNSVQGVGPQIDIDDTTDALVSDVTATVATITPTHAIHPIVGTTNSLGTISTPYEPRVDGSGTSAPAPTHTGPIFLIPLEAVVLVDSGNIAIPSSPKTLTASQALILVYDGTSWYPAAY